MTTPLHCHGGSDRFSGEDQSGRERAELRRVLATFASGVTVITTRRPDGQPVGITASSFTSLSLDPPLVLVCVARSAFSHPYFVAADGFGVSILSACQGEVAQRYATVGAMKFHDDEHFAGPTLGVSLICGAIAHLECRRHDVVPGGDHVIIVGRVVAARGTDAAPLVNFARRFGTFVHRPAEAGSKTSLSAE